jgi:hypothetical protein
MGRRSSTSSCVLPWWPAVLMVWWPTTIFHFALDCTKAVSTSYKNSIMSDTVHNFTSTSKVLTCHAMKYVLMLI